jgi:hypothetical protein
MNRNDFLRIIETSGPADRQTIGEISELITIFPYFQSAYMLMLRGLRNTGDVKFENQLKTTAMHIADREVLYYFLKKENIPAEEIISSPTKEKTIEINSSDSQQVVIETARNSEELINEIEKSSGEDRQGEDNQGSLQETGHSILISAETADNDSAVSVLVIDEESGSVEEKIIFMDPGFSFPEQPDLLELDTEKKVTEVPADESGSNEAESGIPEVSVKQLQSDLIDKFILANPRIEPRKEKSDAPLEDISRPFVDTKSEFVTETLARIYTNQGYYSRAIDIYEKLCLKFPEKSSYFASQIERVKNLIKQE